MHLGYMFGICVEKNSQLVEHLRKFTGRVVFQGNQVYDKNYDYAIFQDLGSSPANLQAAKAVDCFGCLPGHAIEIADAEQAYIHADMKGDPTWVVYHLRHARNGGVRNFLIFGFPYVA